MRSVFAVTNSDDFYRAHLLGDLQSIGVQLLPWEELEGDYDDAAAVLLAPGPGMPAQAYVHPRNDIGLLALVVQDAERRLKAHAAGDPEVFQSYDPGTGRRVAVIYDHRPR